MYCVNGKPRSSLLIESTDSMMSEVFHCRSSDVIHSIGNQPQNTMVVFKMRDSVPSPRYSAICNVLRQWKTSLIPTYRVYRLYDERGFPLPQYITNGGISRAGYTITHFKHHHRVLRLISNRVYNIAIIVQFRCAPREAKNRHFGFLFLFLFLFLKNEKTF